ncbi:DUF952 domain-containing protein [Yinghuangia soli]|uniref:DUF952 domain-containing protein n=1 Tax=Yinghuangia soli TaxID=2908204 RepID=A0AA41Q3M0_9ACTN|nr:DUF952 domain-containing protein [Yinghuangia soli]MCF2530928.1 DUF952 domain-containing protein [Yinghuangia soli]
MDPSVIYKLLTGEEWESAEAEGVFAGSAADRADGYIHFSTAAQVAETARRHFAGVPGLTLLAVDAGALGDDLRWEPSRGGDLFPHLYADLPTSAVTWVAELPDPQDLEADGSTDGDADRDADGAEDPGDAVARAVTEALARM